MEPEKKQTTQVAVSEKNICDQVAARIKEMTTAGMINLPSDYSPGNALKSAWLTILDTVDKDKRPALEVCTKESVSNALLKMAIQGLSVAKGQGYFVVYGNKLVFMRSYQGSVAVSKRVGLKWIKGVVIYAGDIFKFKISEKTGIREIIEHSQDFQNIDFEKIIGAYAIYELEDGTKDVEIMNIKQINKAWLMGKFPDKNGNKSTGVTHEDFKDEMAKKTVIGRVCKSIIGQSSDAYLFKDSSEEIDEKNEVIDTEHEVISIKEITQEATPEHPEPPAENPNPQNPQPETQPEKQAASEIKFPEKPQMPKK